MSTESDIKREREAGTGPSFFGKRRRTIHGDLIVRLVAVIILTSILLSGLYSWFISSLARSAFEKKADRYVQYLQEALTAPLWTFEYPTLRKICEAFMKNDDVAEIRIISYLGTVLFEAEKPGHTDLLHRRVGISFNNQMVGEVEIRLTRRSHRKHLFLLMLSNLLLMLVTILVIIIATRLMLYFYLHKPLDYLIGRIRKMTGGDFNYELKKYPQIEIQAIIGDFNRMGTEISKREMALKALNEKFRKEIEERIQAERRLRESERRLSQIINFLPDPTFVIDSRSRVIAWNQAIEQLTEVQASEMLNKGNYEYAIPFYGERRPILVDLVRNWDEDILHKYEYVRKKGDVLISETRNPPFIRGESHFWNAASPLYDEKNHIVGAIETIRDITEQKRVEMALKKSELHFRSLFHSSPDGIVLTDFKGKIIDVNKSLLKMTGQKRETLIHSRITGLVPEQYHEEIIRNIRSIRKGIAEDVPLEAAYLKHDDSSVSASVRTWVVTDDRSKALAVGAFIKDISRQKAMQEEKDRLEKQLLQNRKMEAIGTLAGGIAHDFNNILGGIIGYSEMIELKIGAENPEIRRYIRRILEAGNRARDLVRQILQFSRRADAVMVPVQIRTVVKEAVRLLRATIPKTIEIRQEITANTQTVCGDGTQIHQVIMNLCTNAWQAMRDTGGVLTVQLDRIALKEERHSRTCEILPGEYVQLTVADTGPGIPPEIQDRIFEPYFTTKMKDEGTGLGLSVSFGIVKKHGGLIELESAAGEGTTFRIFLPVHQHGKDRNGEADISLPAGNRERILLVDDEQFFIEAMQEHLESLNYSVAAFHESRKAMDFFMENPDDADLILTDLTMPEMTGIELISEIRKRNNAVPVILCTGYSDNISEKTAKRYGISKFLLKPVTRKVLAKSVHELVRKNGIPDVFPLPDL